jgi:hypothetical protein
MATPRIRKRRRPRSVGKILDEILKNPGKLVVALKRWSNLVAEGADPIEAMHGHKCGPDCMHNYGKTKPRE